jgi:tRNA nucleotidyltransferase/poly(A) polymerase
VSELLELYSEMNQTFGLHLKEFQNEFKMILEGEQSLTLARNRLSDSNKKKLKIVNQIEEAQAKDDIGMEELRKLWEKLDDVKQQIRQVSNDFLKSEITL